MEFLIDPILPQGQIHILAGASTAGKTTLLFQMLHCFQQGRTIIGFPSFPCPFVYIGADRACGVYEALAADLGVSFPMINVVELFIEKVFDPTTITLKMLGDFIDSNISPAPELFVFDPPDSLIGINNWNDKMQVVRGMLRLSRFLQERTAIIVLHATKIHEKNRFLNVYDQIPGSASLQAYAGTRGFLVASDKKHDGNAVVRFIGQRFPEHVVVLQRNTMNGSFHVVSVESEWRNCDFIRQVFKKRVGKCRRLDLYNELVVQGKMSESTLDKILRRMVTSKEITKVDFGEYSL